MQAVGGVYKGCWGVGCQPLCFENECCRINAELMFSVSAAAVKVPSNSSFESSVLEVLGFPERTWEGEQKDLGSCLSLGTLQ